MSKNRKTSEAANESFPAPKRINQHAMGILYIIMAAFSFSLMSLFVRLSGDVPTMEKAFFRNAVAAIIACILLSRTPEKFHIKKGSLRDLILRSVFGSAGILANFWAIDHLAIADANVLNKLSPFFAIIMSAFILKEFANKFEWVTVIIAFVGALFIIKPTAGLASLPALLGLFSGFAAGTAYTFVRKLGTHGERGPVIVMFFSTFSCAICVPYLILDFHPMALWQLGTLILAGVAAMGGQLSITAAYTHAPAKEISVFDYIQVLFAAIWGFAAFGEIPDRLSIIGYVIIIAMAVLKWYYNLHPRTSADPG